MAKPTRGKGAAKGEGTTELDALLAVTGQARPKKEESLKDFTQRVLEAMVVVTDDKFDALPKQVRDWYDSAHQLYNDDKFDQIPTLVGMPGHSAAPEQPAAAVEKEQRSSTEKEEKVRKEKGSKQATKEKSKSKADGEGRKPRTDSATYRIRMAVVRNPDISFEKVVSQLGLKAKEANSNSHAFNTYQHARSVLALAAEHAKK